MYPMLAAGCLLMAGTGVAADGGGAGPVQGASAPQFDAAKAVQLARDFLAAEKVEATGLRAFRMPAPKGWWMVEYRVPGRPVAGDGPVVFVNEQTGEVTRQAPAGAPPRM